MPGPPLCQTPASLKSHVEALGACPRVIIHIIIITTTTTTTTILSCLLFRLGLVASVS